MRRRESSYIECSIPREVTRMGQAVAGMDLPCDWAQFLHTCAERGIIIIASWYREGPGMTQLLHMNHGHPDGDLMTSLLAYHWFCSIREFHRQRSHAWNYVWKEEEIVCTRVGLMHHVMHSIYESVRLLSKTFESYKDSFPQVRKREREIISPGF